MKLPTIIEAELPLSNKTLNCCNLLLPNHISMNAGVIGQNVESLHI